MKQFFIFFSVILLLAVSFSAAQDTRTVTEPVLPPACTSLDAQLSIRGRSLAQADEVKLDTMRIQ